MAEQTTQTKILLAYRDHLANETDCPQDKIVQSIAKLLGLKATTVRNGLSRGSLGQTHLARIEERLLLCQTKCVCPPLWGGSVQDTATPEEDPPADGNDPGTQPPDGEAPKEPNAQVEGFPAYYDPDDPEKKKEGDKVHGQAPQRTF